MTLASDRVKLKTEDGPQTVSMEAVSNAMGEDGEEFLGVMKVVQAIQADPATYTGRQAVIRANELAAWRTEIGIKAQYYKTAPKSDENRTRKDVLLLLYNALPENINALKLMARLDGVGN
jgi:hypothetical protein